MRTLKIFLIFLLILGGYFFFGGWISLQIPGQHMALVYSKTHGWHTDVIESGEFFWKSWAALPTNVTVYPIIAASFGIDGRVAANLPSAELYKAYVSGSPEFAISFRYSARFNLNKDQLVPLFSKENFSKGQFETFMEDIKADVQAWLNGQILEVIAYSNPEGLIPAFQKTEEDLIAKNFISQYPWLLMEQLSVEISEFPDVSLYQLARANYLATENDLRTNWEHTIAEINSLYFAQEKRLSLLRSFGKILSDEPTLLEYLREVMASGNDPLGVQEFIKELIVDAVEVQ